MIAKLKQAYPARFKDLESANLFMDKLKNGNPPDFSLCVPVFCKEEKGDKINPEWITAPYEFCTISYLEEREKMPINFEELKPDL